MIFQLKFNDSFSSAKWESANVCLVGIASPGRRLSEPDNGCLIGIASSGSSRLSETECLFGWDS